MTITQTVEIPADRWLKVKVPNEIPAGKAQVELKVISFVNKKRKPELAAEQCEKDLRLRGSSPKPPLKCLVGVSTPRSDRLLGTAANLGDITLDEIRDERMAKITKLPTSPLCRPQNL